VKFNHRGAQKKSRQGNLMHQSITTAKLTKSFIEIAFISILSRRLVRLVTQEISA
jgi:hypothetical protein